jgi:aminotransferase
MCDISAFGWADDVSFCRHLVEDVGVAAVPGSSFFSDPAHGAHLIRFCFAKQTATLEAAGARLARLRAG